MLCHLLEQDSVVSHVGNTNIPDDDLPIIAAT